MFLAIPQLNELNLDYHIEVDRDSAQDTLRRRCMPVPGY
jgi:hypothetical protein